MPDPIPTLIVVTPGDPATPEVVNAFALHERGALFGRVVGGCYEPCGVQEYAARRAAFARGMSSPGTHLIAVIGDERWEHRMVSAFE